MVYTKSRQQINDESKNGSYDIISIIILQTI